MRRNGERQTTALRERGRERDGVRGEDRGRRLGVRRRRGRRNSSGRGIGERGGESAIP